MLVLPSQQPYNGRRVSGKRNRGQDLAKLPDAEKALIARLRDAEARAQKAPIMMLFPLVPLTVPVVLLLFAPILMAILNLL